MSLECSIFAPETHPGWKAGKSIALCKSCDQKEYVLVEDGVDQELNEGLTDDEDEEESIEFDCASRGYHVYRKVWLPKKKDKLIVAFEKNNVYDPCACGLYLLTNGTIFGKCLVGHIPRELSRFTKFFLDYGGLLYCESQGNKISTIPIATRWT